MVSKDWLPHSYAKMLEMCGMWDEVLTAPVRAELGIPAEVWNDYGTKRERASEVFAKSRDPTQHTPIVTVALVDAFKDLDAIMRYIHDRYLFIPPLTAEQWVALGLKLPDKTPTEIDVPKEPPEVRATSPRHRLLRFDFKAPGARRRGKPPNVSEMEVRYLISDKTPIENSELVNSETATKNPLEIEFNESDRGKKLFFIARWKAGANKKGPWTDIMFVFIS